MADLLSEGDILSKFSLRATIAKPSECYKVQPHVQVYAPDSLKANGKFFALPWTGGMVANHVGIVDQLLSGGVTNQSFTPQIITPNRIMAMEFDPFNEYRLATAGEEGGIKLWKIPEENLTANIETPQAHIRMRDVAHIKWNPTAAGVLLAANPYQISAFDVENPVATFWRVTSSPLQSFTWDYEGKEVFASFADRSIRLYDLRQNRAARTIENAHESTKHSQIINLKDWDKFMTCSYSKSSMRQLKFFDVRQLDEPLGVFELEDSSSSSPTSLIFDPDTRFMLFTSRGNTSTQIYRISRDLPYCELASSWKSPFPHHLVTLLPKSTCAVERGEIIRVATVNNEDLRLVKFYLAEGSETSERPVGWRSLTESRGETKAPNVLYEKVGYYTDTPSIIPALTAKEWCIDKRSAPPNFVPVSGGGALARDLSRALQDSEFADINFVLDSGEKVKAHKCIVAVRCEALNELIRVAMVNGRDEVAIPNTERPTLDVLLSFLYTDRLPIFDFLQYGSAVIELARSLNLTQLESLVKHRMYHRQGSDRFTQVFTSTYLADMKRLLDYPDDYYCDLDIVVAERDIKGHRVVVSYRAKMIETILKAGMREAAERKITFGELSAADGVVIMTYLYTGQAMITSENVMDIWQAASSLNFTGLRGVCERFIQEAIDVENCIALLLRAELVGSRVLKYAILNFIISSYETVKRSEAGSQLTTEHREFIEARAPVKATRLNLAKYKY